MVKAAVWVSVVVLGWMWTLQGVPADSDCLNQVNGTMPCEASEEEKERGAFNATVCNAEPQVGPCKALKRRYFYNSTSAACEIFHYGGCGGNRNNFKTEAECLQLCHTPEED